MSEDVGGHPVALGPGVRPSGRPHRPGCPIAMLATTCSSPKGHAHVELSLSFVSEDEMADLHQRFMAEPGPTDVLTFPLDEDDRTEDGPARARRRRDRARGRGAQQPRRPARPSSGCWSCTASCTSWATTTRRRRARRDVGAAGALQRGGGPVIGWIVVVALVILGSLLALAESALTRMTRVKALALEDEGRRNAALLVKLETDPPRYLNSVYLVRRAACRTARRSWSRSWRSGPGATASSRSPRWCSRCCYFVFVEAMSKTFGVLAQRPRGAGALAPRVLPRVGCSPGRPAA